MRPIAKSGSEIPATLDVEILTAAYGVVVPIPTRPLLVTCKIARIAPLLVVELIAKSGTLSGVVLEFWIDSKAYGVVEPMLTYGV